MALNTAAQNPNTRKIIPASPDRVGINRGQCSFFERPMSGNNLGDRLRIVDDSFIEYVWGGTEWAAGAGQSNSASKVADPINSVVYAYAVDGTVTKRCMPLGIHIEKKGVGWFWPTVKTATAALSVDLDTSGAFITQSDVNANQAVLITAIQATYTDMTWSGLSLAYPADGLLQVLMWWPDVANGDPSPGSFDISLTNAGGAIKYSFSTSAMKAGWNTLQLWNPNTVAHVICNKAGVSYVNGTPTFDYTTNVTAVRLTISSPAAGAAVRLAGIFTHTRLTPTFCMTFDTSAADIFTNFCPIWKAAGWTAGLRSGGADSYRQASWITLLRQAVADGFDIVNGSWSRAALNSSTTEAAFAREVGLQQAFQARNGLTRGSTMFCSAGNSLPKWTVLRKVLAAFGYKSAKAGTAAGYFTPCGPAGIDDRYAINAVGFPGLTVAKTHIDGLKYVGGILLYFAHDCPTGGTDPNTTPQANGGGIWAEHVPLLRDYIQADVASGAMLVVGPSGLDNLLDAIA